MKNITPKIYLDLQIAKRFFVVSVSLCLFGLLIFLTACSELEKPKTETFYADSEPPVRQEFRWSNGKMPKSFDPAKASAPPETDVVRAIYDGLTETEPKTLKAIPAISYKWSSSNDYKKWTFKLRQDAKWSNGEKVTAKDFVRSWKRLSEMGEDVSHNELLKNIVGLRVEEKVAKTQKKEETKKESKSDIFSAQGTAKELEKRKQEVVENVTKKKDEESSDKKVSGEDKVLVAKDEKKTPVKTVKKKNISPEIGVKAIGKHKLEVSLIKPDKDFPNLVAHPIFRPIYGDGKEFEDEKLNSGIVTNGAFRISSVGKDGVTLDKAEYYYDKENIKLERVRFVPSKDAESALQAYKAGEVDVVTNAEFEPLALKILTPFVDFRRTTHSALNFYEFNRKKEPFNDRRVRQALSLSIDRNRVTEDELKGATKPAFNYLPYKEEEQTEIDIKDNFAKAKKLLKTAGFENGEGFPKITLVINRNNIQKRVAKSVAKMWKQNLNIETNIIEKEFDELKTAREEGDFDVIRRGVVLPTSDETANMLAIFSPKKTPKEDEKKDKKEQSEPKEKAKEKTQNTGTKPTLQENSNTNSPKESDVNNANSSENDELLIDTGEEEKIILTEEEAFMEVPAIPLYFPTSYSLIKPYVEGFDMNTLDAPLLKDVEINNNWQPKKTDDES